jgi:hypothetical protein
MNPTTPLLPIKTIAWSFPALVLCATAALAQAPAPANPPGRAGAPTAATLTRAQQDAVVAMNQSLSALVAAAAAARNELIAVSLTVPHDEPAIRARSETLAAAELALAAARSERFAQIQSSANRLAEADIARLVAQGGQGGGGRGGRGPLVNSQGAGLDPARQQTATPTTPAVVQTGGGGVTPPRTDAMAPRPAAMSNLLTVAQQKVLDRIGQATQAQTAAVTAARQALVAASFAVPRNDADLRARAVALGEAEKSLALARAEKFGAAGRPRGDSERATCCGGRAYQ